MSSKATVLINYLKNIESGLNNKVEPYSHLRNKVGSIIKRSKKTNKQTSKPLQNDPIRNEWKIGSIVQIYSASHNEWQKGEIVDINFDKKGEWNRMQIKYGKNRSKQMQRFSDHIRPLSKPIQKPKQNTNKSKKNDQMISTEEIRNEILNIIKIHSPNEINSINKLMKTYKNKEHQLLYSLCIKYKQKYTKIVPKTLKNTYQIGPKLGVGGFAIVRKCKRRSDGKLFAMKIIEKSKYKNGKQLLLLENEINIMRKLSHPNVIKLYDIFENNNKICLILDLCEGKSIFDAIIENNDKGFCELDAKLIFYYLCIALEYIHNKHIVHRDLKIEDLLFQKKDLKTPSSIIIIDFGLCGYLGENNYLNEPVGTPNYVSPEILKKQKYNAQVDMWSIGVILYIMLGGYHPFYIQNQNENTNKLYELIKLGKYEPLTSGEWNYVSDIGKDLVIKLLEVNPLKRLSASMALRHEWILYITVISGYIRMESKNEYLVLFATEIVSKYYG